MEDIPDYPAGTWTLAYAAKNAAGGFAVGATASGWQHFVRAEFSETEDFAPGIYQVVRWVESGGTRKTIDVQTWEILPDVRQGVATQPVDLRSTVQQMLDAADAAIKALLANTNKSVTLPNGIMYTKRDLGELVALRDKLRAEVNAEKNAARLAAGLQVGGKLLVRG